MYNKNKLADVSNEGSYRIQISLENEHYFSNPER